MFLMLFLFGCDFLEKQEAREKAMKVEWNELKDKIVVSVIVRTQEPSSGWNRVRAKTYIKLLSNGTLTSISGLWGREGDTLRQPYIWYYNNGMRDKIN
jgi:hypothetical protein